MTDHLHSAQRARSLDQLSSPRGIVAGAAVDHRDSLQSALARRGLELDADGITALKLRIARALAPAASLVLLDAEYAAAQAVAAGALPGRTGLVVPLEAMGYGDVARLPVTGFLEGWSPAQPPERSSCCRSGSTSGTRRRARRRSFRKPWRAAAAPGWR